MNPVIIIGIDGATPQLLYNWIQEGTLPTFQHLQTHGSWGTLKSTIPPFSAPAWTSIITGCNPGKHGIYGFESTGTLTPHLINSTHRKTPAIWTYLTQLGFNNIIINVPGTYPPEKINGSMITGLLTPSPDSTYTYPDSLKHRLTPDDLGQYDLEHFWLADFSRARLKKQNPEHLIQIINQQMTQRATIALNLMKTTPWNFTMLVFRGTDTAQHFLFDHPHLLKKCYQHVDHLIHTIYHTYPNYHYIIVSDHGFEPINYVLYPDNVLYNHHLLTPNIDPLKSTTSHLLTIFYHLLTNTLKHLPPHLIQKFPIIKQQLFQNATKEKLINFTHTQVFSTADGRGLQICLKNKYPQGTVSLEDYQKLCQHLKTLFLNLKHPTTNQPIITNVYLSTEAYGPHAQEPPDLVFSLDTGITASEWIRFPQTIKETIQHTTTTLPELYPFDNIGRSGDHAENGIFIATGPEIKHNHHINTLTVEDILPLTFQLLHLPIPNNVTGHIPTTILNHTKISKPINWNTLITPKTTLTTKELNKITQLKKTKQPPN